jgi:hypothetical protein
MLGHSKGLPGVKPSTSSLFVNEPWFGGIATRYLSHCKRQAVLLRHDESQPCRLSDMHLMELLSSQPGIWTLMFSPWPKVGHRLAVRHRVGGTTAWLRDAQHPQESIGHDAN